MHLLIPTDRLHQWGKILINGKRFWLLSIGNHLHIRVILKEDKYSIHLILSVLLVYQIFHKWTVHSIDSNIWSYNSSHHCWYWSKLMVKEYILFLCRICWPRHGRRGTNICKHCDWSLLSLRPIHWQLRSATNMCPPPPHLLPNHAYWHQQIAR